MSKTIIKYLAPAIFLLATPMVCTSQETDSIRLMPDISFSGYIKSDFIFDSRQNVSVRENMLLLYPRPVVTDENGSDINDVSHFHFIPFQTRVTARFSGTEILGARIGGLLEAEFFGNTEPTANELRLRHASITMDWESGVSVLMGQFWHPLFITQCFPTTASINTGIPFNPFSRNPQFEISWRRGNIRLSGAALSQIDFRSNGPLGSSTQYLRNSGMPELVGKFIYFSNDNSLVFGAAAAFKQLTPRLTDNRGNRVDENVGSSAFMGFTRYTNGLFTFKTAGLVGQDMFHLTMIGGYAIKSENSYEYPELLDNSLKYTPVKIFSGWGELIYGDKWEFGLFAGYSKNLGAEADISLNGSGPVFFSRGADIDYLYRMSPRISYNMKNLRLGIETEYTAAAYSDTTDNMGRPQNSSLAGNRRILLFAFYHF